MQSAKKSVTSDMKIAAFSGVRSVADFWTFVNKRQAVYNARQQGVPRDLWTDDPLLKTFKFCNVYRELDRGTVWCVDHILSPQQERGDLRTLTFQVIVYRLLNSVKTFEAVGLPKLHATSIRYFSDRLQARSDSGVAVWGNAYASCAQPCRGEKKPRAGSRLKNFFMGVDSAYHECREEGLSEAIFSAPSLEKAWKLIQRVYAVGGFIGYEIMMDLMYTGRTSYTENDYVYVGPGALEGLRLIFGDLKQSDLSGRLDEIWGDQSMFTERWMGQPLSKANIEQALCEFRKYTALELGVGRPKHYTPADAERLP